MTEWPYGEHDDIPDAISDLDKQDKEGKHYAPAPPMGWRAAQGFVQKPAIIDGRYNADYGYPANEHIKALKAKGNELWQTQGSGTPQPVNASFWRKQPQQPKLPGKS